MKIIFHQAELLSNLSFFVAKKNVSVGLILLMVHESVGNAPVDMVNVPLVCRVSYMSGGFSRRISGCHQQYESIEPNSEVLRLYHCTR